MVLTIAQVVVSITLIILILFQERSSGVGGIFGGSEGGFYQTRRGLEKAIFISTIVLMIIFGILSLLNLVF